MCVCVQLHVTRKARNLLFHVAFAALPDRAEGNILGAVGEGLSYRKLKGWSVCYLWILKPEL